MAIIESKAGRSVATALVRLNAHMLGGVLALLFGGGLCVITWLLLWQGGAHTGQMLSLLAHLLPGFAVSPVGAIVGGVGAAVRDPTTAPGAGCSPGCAPRGSAASASRRGAGRRCAARRTAGRSPPMKAAGRPPGGTEIVLLRTRVPSIRRESGQAAPAVRFCWLVWRDWPES